MLRAACCFGLACVLVFRALGRSLCLARVVAFRIFVLSGARGSSQRGLCRQRFVLRAQAKKFAALPGIQSSAIVSAKGGAACCRLTFRSRRTAAPPLNSSVRPRRRIRHYRRKDPRSKARTVSRIRSSRAKKAVSRALSVLNVAHSGALMPSFLYSLRDILPKQCNAGMLCGSKDS